MSKGKNKKEVLTKSQHQKLAKFFPITSLSREDLIHPLVGFSESKALRMTDAQMERIARKLADDYCEQLFWSSLKIIAEYVQEEK